ncbi:MAG: flavoprotein [Synergistaceae bacterium]|jgi:flavoprotein|nr:flavoprotein [Synergistaceae bacterium]
MFKKICWVATGAGHFLDETADVLASLRSVRVDLYFTRAGAEVAAKYGLFKKLEACVENTFRENDFSSGSAIYFAGGRYDALVIAPATANTVAKCVLGVADSLASNFFAQAGKSGVPIIILPTDAKPEMESTTISGRKIKIRPRPIDLQRTEELSRFPGVTTVLSPESLRLVLNSARAPEF